MTTVKKETLDNNFESSITDLKEQVTVEISKKIKDEISNDYFYKDNEKIIENYIQKSKFNLEFLEKSILESLRNYFTKNELEELHQLFNKEENNIIDHISSFIDKLKVNLNVYYMINSTISDQFYSIKGKKRELRAKIAVKIYQLEEHKVFILMQFLFKYSYESKKDREYVINKLT